MQRISAPLAVFLRLTLALAVGLGLTPALHAKAGFVIELCSPDGAVAMVLDGSLPADCPDCPDCLLSGPADLANPTGLAPRPLLLQPAALTLPEPAAGALRHIATPMARAPPVLTSA
jgi:hypothetical protein